MTKRELRLKKRRARYALRKDELNLIRRSKYAVAVKSGLNYKEARRTRGFSLEHIAEDYENIRIDVKDNVKYIYVYIPVYIEYEKIDLPQIEKVSERTRKRRLARSLGYTPKEADYMRDVAEEKWDRLIDNRNINAEARELRWAEMASRKRFDKNIIEACEAINIEEGYDINSRYGWGVYYFWHLHGGDIEDWKDYVLPDTFITDMLDYQGNASTYLFRMGRGN